MALKQLPPLTKKQYDFVIKKLNTESTQDQIAKAKLAISSGRKIKTISPWIFFEQFKRKWNKSLSTS